MYHYPINYDEPLFRPPSEAYSLIIQVTLGCSYNNCAFCEMYTSKQFKARKEEDVFKDIEAFLPYKDQVRKVFLADGDPMVLSTERLLRILHKLKTIFPKLQRISTYATPTNIIRKSAQELHELKNAGLDLLYVGIESGDDEVLNAIQKGETFSSVVLGLNKAKQAEINSSVMIINGIGGKLFTKQHAINSAKVLNETQPKYASTLVLTTYKGLEHFKSRFLGNFQQLFLPELFDEMKIFMNHLELNETIFRSDHASNHLVLKGVLGKDKEQFLKQIELAIHHPEIANLRNQYQRGF
ncbi:MAG: B12-binding domain-containing radical SAM protein [Flavobacteriales bacterium]|nr:B12-binding domain-containing radical SAM protein [Flavobacteriales bacterium]MCL4856722.1 B12-binding domain-containing radical SAM protein [Flavobacteriales bacterium]